VIKVIWGSEWDALIEKDVSGKLLQRMEEVVDGELLKYVVEGGAYFREHFFGKHPETLDLVSHINDDDLIKMKLGGHDPAKMYAAYKEATEHRGRPTVILARTIKGYGLGEAGEGRNITHNQKKLNENELLYFRDRFDVPLSDEEAITAPFFKPKPNSKEIKYIKERRNNLGGFTPSRVVSNKRMNPPKTEIFKELLEGTGEREISTTMAFVRLLTILCRDKNIGKNIVPLIPGEPGLFGMGSLF
jgi:Pyruvate dehydrogenase complex, dehydrogenase (E1) component